MDNYWNWWYRGEFTAPTATAGQAYWLRFKGISYRAQIWLNGTQIEANAGVEHRFGKRRRLAAVETLEKARHEKRGHLIVGYVSRRVRHDERAPLSGIELSAVAFSLYEPQCEH